MKPTSVDQALALVRFAQENPNRIAISRQEAAEALGYSYTHFAQNVLPQLRTFGEGRAMRITIAELVAWCERSAKP